MRLILEGKLARAQRLLSNLETEARARSLGTGRAVTVLALEGGAIAFRREGDTLRLPLAEGHGEPATRHLLQTTFGSAVGDLALLGTATGRGTGKLQEVWLARRMRLDGDAGRRSRVGLRLRRWPVRAGGPELQDADTVSALAVAMRSELLREAEPAGPVRRSRPSKPPVLSPSEAALLLDEDLSVLEFQSRVLAMAEDPETPLLERLTFISIVSSNLDEFYMVNAGALKRGSGGEEEARLEAIGIRVRSLLDRQQRALADCLARLGAAGVRVTNWASLDPTNRALLEEQFRREIFPLLTPRAITVSPGFPVPLMPQLTVLMAIMVQDVEAGPLYFAYLRFPERVPRFLPVPGRNDVIPLEEVVRANLALFYPDREIEGAWLFRLTRAAELDLDDEDAGNLLQAVEESVGRRALNAIVRVEVERAMPQSVRDRLLWELRFERGSDAGAVGERDLVEIDGLADLRALRELAGAPVPGGRFPPFEGRNPWPVDRELWTYLRERDRLVHHPHDNFSDTVVRFFREGRGRSRGGRDPAHALPDRRAVAHRRGSHAGPGAGQGRGDLRGARRRASTRRAMWAGCGGWRKAEPPSCSAWSGSRTTRRWGWWSGANPMACAATSTSPPATTTLRPHASTRISASSAPTMSSPRTSTISSIS